MNPPNYEALDCHGHAYVRPAQVVCELPTAARQAALGSATQEVAKLLNIPAKRRISFGTPTFEAFGLNRAQAKNHPQAKLLLMAGHLLPLTLCPEYN